MFSWRQMLPGVSSLREKKWTFLQQNHADSAGAIFVGFPVQSSMLGAYLVSDLAYRILLFSWSFAQNCKWRGLSHFIPCQHSERSCLYTDTHVQEHCPAVFNTNIDIHQIKCAHGHLLCSNREAIERSRTQTYAVPSMASSRQAARSWAYSGILYRGNPRKLLPEAVSAQELGWLHNGRGDGGNRRLFQYQVKQNNSDHIQHSTKDYQCYFCFLINELNLKPHPSTLQLWKLFDIYLHSAKSFT